MLEPNSAEHSARDRPKRSFYEIVPLDDGTVDVYLNPTVTVYPIEDGFREYDVHVLLVRGVVPYPGIEEDIRANFYKWCDAAEAIDL